MVGKNEALFGILHGNVRHVIITLAIEVPTKCGYGGSKLKRTARVQAEQKLKNVEKIRETARQCFITNDEVNVIGIILATETTYENEFQQLNAFDTVS